MSYKCVGCDSAILYTGVGTLAYTCRCGATLFYEVETSALVLPTSLVFAIHKFKMGGSLEAPHIDYYLGNSNRTSEIRESVTRQLLEIGFVWMKDCKQCQEDGTYARELEREKREIVDEAEKIIRLGREE